jgi:pSer/pThr/pTyr-binding forkhead associated (FHA) protein
MLSNETSFLALGIAIGSRTPWLVLSERNRNLAPSSLQGLNNRIEYTTLLDLEANLPNIINPFLKLITPRRFPKQDKTETISLPFWIDFEQWIVSVTHTAHTPKNIVGQIRVLIYEANNFLRSHVIAAEGLLFGRSSECDVVLESSMISSKHFQIVKVRERYFIKDLYSTNGTYLNGALLNPRNKVEIYVGDIIIVHGTRFVIWDDRPLPEQGTAQTLKVTDMLADSVKRIEFTDIPPPPYLATWDRWLRLVALHPDGYTSLQFEVQDYYPMGRVLSELASLMELPKKEYHFLFRNRVIGEKETPLSIGIKSGSLLQISSE